jgi:hypothetical protein
MPFLDDILDYKYSLSQWHITHEDFENVEFAPVYFNLAKEIITQFAKEGRGFPTDDGRARARRNKDDRLIIRRPFDGIVRRLEKINELEYMILGSRILYKERIPPEKLMINFHILDYEYVLNIDIRADVNFNSLLDSLSSTEPDPQFLEGILQKRDRFTKEVISESEISFVEVTNKYWNSTNNKYSWFEVFYMIPGDSKNRDLELRRILEANFDGKSHKLREKHQEARALEMLAEYEAEQARS